LLWIRFLLFSHPADFTPVCTTEFVAFQKRYDEFRKLNTELIGLSVDQVFAHIKWQEWIKEKLQVEIEFPIIADTGKVAEILGLIHPGKGTNNELVGDRLITPPAQDVDSAAKRLKEYECYDWWFFHKAASAKK
jgi:alkyl hydroperoxide reductase subunit AhpC